MVIDIRPATGAVVTLTRILWGVDGSSPASVTCARMRFTCALSRQFEIHSSVLALPFCVRFSRKANIYKSFVRPAW